MATLLDKAYKMASGFSEKEQEMIAIHWIREMKFPDFIEMIKDELKWEKSFSESQELLEILAHQALKEIGEEKAEPIGWDEL